MILSVFGAVIEIIKPNVYGLFSLSFSRISRGELTYWRVMGLYVVAAPIGLIIYEQSRKVMPLIFSVLMWIVCFAQSTRMLAIVSFIPFVLYLVIRQRNVKKLISTLFVFSFLYYMRERIVSFISIGGVQLSYESVSYVLNGRLELWKYCLQKFISHPLLGNRSGFINRYNDYYFSAASEIGLLKWYSEYGVLYGFLLTWMTIKAFIRAIMILKNRLATNTDLFVAYLYIAQVFCLVESFSRVLSFTDYLFWFCLYYLNMYKSNMVDKVYRLSIKR